MGQGRSGIWGFGHKVFRRNARTYANGEVYRYFRDKCFLIKVPVSWRELHARGQKLQRNGHSIGEVCARLAISKLSWSSFVEACSLIVFDLSKMKDTV